MATVSAVAGLYAFSTSAQAQQLCSDYTVASGDTLSKIAQTAKVRGGYQTLFNANSNVLDNPNLLEVGVTLQIPCADGALPVAKLTTADIPVAEAPENRPEALDRPLRIVTASGYAPFTDENLEGGGALTRMVERAMALGNPDQDYQLLWVDDWGSHLNTLLPSGAADMVFPWFRPDCSKIEFLSESSAKRCTDFNTSDPLYDALIGFYTVKGGEYEGAKTSEDLFGARLCRPAAWFTFDLEADQLMPPNVAHVRPEPQNGCWQLLMDGEVDIVTLDALPAEEDYRTLGFEGQIAHLDALSTKQTLHVFVDINNAEANAALPVLNKGIEELRLSGEWFELVRTSITETLTN